ncbi:MAG: 4-hydroxy-tetrahydrodipicolinate reductase [Ferruginibacter sp.]
MKIALIGYGKMGKAIEETAIGRGHTISLKINSSNLADLTAASLQQADVAIEFTSPHSAKDNIMLCLEAGIPVVSGSTGWLEQWKEVEAACQQLNGSFLYASNFSVGVNIFFAINRHLARLMNQQAGYSVSIEEIHHTQKKDAPSGTAITLAEQILQEVTRKKSWVNHVSNQPEELPIISKRIDPAPGTHIVNYHSPVDDITISHIAHNRQGFALGAVLAAEYIAGKKGIFNMQQVLFPQ